MFNNILDPSLELQQAVAERNITLQKSKLVSEIAIANVAEQVYLRLKNIISQYEEMLDLTQEIGLQWVNFGQTMNMRVDAMGYSGYDLIIFRGSGTDGKPLILVQNISQLNFLLTSESIIPKMPDEEPKRRKIGFITDDDISFE